jgi:hypothetical protein
MDLAQLREQSPGPTALAPIAPPCPGASLRLDRDQYRAMRQGGETFRPTGPGEDPIPVDALGNVRVSCSQPVAQLPKTASGNVQYYGLCHSCSGLEVENRRWLRSRSGER